MAKVLSINTFSASALIRIKIRSLHHRAAFHTNRFKGKGENKGTEILDFSPSPFPPSHCLERQLREVSRRLCRLRSPSIPSTAQDPTAGPVSFSLDVSIQWISPPPPLPGEPSQSHFSVSRKQWVETKKPKAAATAKNSPPLLDL